MRTDVWMDTFEACVVNYAQEQNQGSIQLAEYLPPVGVPRVAVLFVLNTPHEVLVRSAVYPYSSYTTHSIRKSCCHSQMDYRE